MKKNIIYGAILVLACIITFEVTYLIMDKKENDNIIENKKQDENKNNQYELENNNKEPIKMNEYELEEYLTYIPTNYIDSNDNEFYKIKNINLEQINNNSLIGNALKKLVKSEEDKITKSEVDKIVIKMYNKNNLSIKTNETEITDGTYIYTFDGTYFTVNDYTNFPNYINILDSYKATKDELIIYAYAVYLDEEYAVLTGEKSDLYNAYDNEAYSVDCDNVTCMKNYINGHKNEFTKYKHTFKKNNTGYYWYSTEVA